ncbi:hypothetical protein CEXT_136531 [Caerostris extrusa]|uniref:Uncharacterized protein n=1 Tax=Caerostris extrusa TaxID=172846 RepID=A0AAV4RIG7_CAEEX|nr:hypothetical protein CEXT_136531 [Caerostris extrusa]
MQGVNRVNKEQGERDIRRKTHMRLIHELSKSKSITTCPSLAAMASALTCQEGSRQRRMPTRLTLRPMCIFQLDDNLADSIGVNLISCYNYCYCFKKRNIFLVPSI